jgi:hypothetical protein
MEVVKMTKKELQEILKDVKEIYAVGNDRWNRFKLYYIDGGKLYEIWIDYEEKDTPSYWVPMHKTRSGNWVGGFFRSNVVGSDRVSEIVYHLGLWLFDDGYKFKPIPLY